MTLNNNKYNIIDSMGNFGLNLHILDSMQFDNIYTFYQCSTDDGSIIVLAESINLIIVVLQIIDNKFVKTRTVLADDIDDDITDCVVTNINNQIKVVVLTQKSGIYEVQYGSPVNTIDPSINKPDFGQSQILALALTPDTDQVVLAFEDAIVESYNVWQISFDSNYQQKKLFALKSSFNSVFYYLFEGYTFPITVRKLARNYQSKEAIFSYSSYPLLLSIQMNPQKTMFGLSFSATVNSYTQLFIDLDLNIIQYNFTLDRGGDNASYSFLKFSDVPKKILLQYYDSEGNSQVCYCSYQYENYQISITSKDICYPQTSRRLFQMYLNQEDKHYYFSNNLFYHKNYSLQSIQNFPSLYFPNDYFEDQGQGSTQNYFYTIDNNSLVLSHSATDIYLVQPKVQEQEEYDIGIKIAFAVAGVTALLIIFMIIRFIILLAKRKEGTRGVQINEEELSEPHGEIESGKSLKKEERSQEKIKENSSPHVKPIRHPAPKKPKRPEQSHAQIAEKECPICFQKNCDSYLRCNHYFHVKCIEQWFKSKKNYCPYCKAISNRAFLKKLDVV